MAQQLRELVALAEDQGLIPNTHRVIHNRPKSTSRRPGSLLTAMGIRRVHGEQMDMEAKPSPTVR